MKQSRKTAAERRQEEAEADARVWESFSRKLEAAHSSAAAFKLVGATPREGAAGRGYYANLGFFLQTRVPPAESSHAEKALYIQLIHRMDAAGEFEPGAMQRIERALRDAMQRQAPATRPRVMTSAAKRSRRK